MTQWVDTTVSTMGIRIIIILSLIAPGVSKAQFKAWHGKQGALVLLVGWKNAPFKYTKSKFESEIFDENSLSLNRYFIENSKGRFSLSGTVLGSRSSEKNWVPEDGCELNPIVQEAWRLFQPEINLDTVDLDRNGKIDNLFIVHSGRIAQDRITPACLFTNFEKAERTSVLQSEGSGPIGLSFPLGLYVHEGGHYFYSLPDLYGDHFHGKYGIGMWGMMGLGCWGVHHQTPADLLFRYPAHFEPASKFRIGWIQPQIITESIKEVKIRPVETSGDIYTISLGSSNLFLEYRSPVGFSEGHPGHGLLIWNNFKLIQADGRDDLNHGRSLGFRPLPPIDENFGDASDPFPGSQKVDFFEDVSHGIRIENIREWPEYIQFDVRLSNRFNSKPLAPINDTFDGNEKL